MFYTNVQPFGNYIALRGVDSDGRSFQDMIRYEPTLFVESHKPQNPQWKTLDNRMVAPVRWGSMKDSRQAIKEYGGDVMHGSNAPNDFYNEMPAQENKPAPATAEAYDDDIPF